MLGSLAGVEIQEVLEHQEVLEEATKEITTIMVTENLEKKFVIFVFFWEDHDYDDSNNSSQKKDNDNVRGSWLTICFFWLLSAFFLLSHCRFWRFCPGARCKSDKMFFCFPKDAASSQQVLSLVFFFPSFEAMKEIDASENSKDVLRLALETERTKQKEADLKGAEIERENIMR